MRRIATLETVEPGAIKELERVMKAKFVAKYIAACISDRWSESGSKDNELYKNRNGITHPGCY